MTRCGFTLSSSPAIQRYQLVRRASAVTITLLALSRAVAATCIGDCDGNGKVSVNELVIGVNIALGNANLTSCPPFDADNSIKVTVDELVKGVNNALNGCPVEPTPTATPSPTPTPTPSSVGTVTPTGHPSPTPSTTAGPAIAFQPMSGPPGSSATITGNGLSTTSSVAFNGTAASFAVGADGTVTAVVPQGATTGPIRVTTSQGTRTSNSVFAVLNPSTFALTVGPSGGSVIQGQSTTYAITLASSNGFTQLADLAVSGLAAGLGATLTPPQITTGQTALLTITAPANQPTGTSAFKVSAAATVLGLPQSQTANASVTVQPVTTSFLGRTVVADTLETALAGVTISFMGQDGVGNATGCSGQTVSDAAGNFAFTNLAQACVGPQLIRYDGGTAVAPPGRYAGVDLVYTLVANQVVTAPVLIHLPRIDEQETVLVQQNAPVDQTFTFKSIPFLSVTVYAGTTFTLADGTQPNPFPLTAVEVPVDRLPEENSPSAQNPNVLLVFIVAFQPANTVASQPVAVTFPNSFNTPPGTNVLLMTLDPARGTMVPYGTGTISNDGTQVLPNADPGHPGHKYGLVHFDWHGPLAPPPNGTNPSPQGFCSPGGTCGCPPNVGSKPVDISSGLEVLTETDVAIGGLRGGLSIVRTYRSGSGNAGPFGIGTGHNYSFQLGLTQFSPGQGVINLVTPDGNQFSFNAQPAGTFLNSTIPALVGAVISNPANGVFDLRWKDGTVFEFQTFGRITVLTAITDANGNVTSIVRGASPAQIAQVIDPVGRALAFQYDGSDRITSITDPIGRTVQYVYNPQGTLATVTDAAGGVTNYAYDNQNRLTQVTDARGVVVAQNSYDQNGRVRQQVLADGGTYSFTYALLNPTAPAISPVLRTTVVDPLGYPTTYHFNPLGFLIDVTDAYAQTRVFKRQAGTNLLLSVTGSASCGLCGAATAGQRSFTYDSNGNILSTTDALGNTATYTYEPVFNKLASVTDPAGNVVGIDYDGRGNTSTFTDANGNRTAFEYDSFGQLTRVIDSLGQATTLSYDGLGNVIALTDAAGQTTSAVYDAASRQIRVTDSLGHTSSNAYDDLDRLAAHTDGRQHTTLYSYDAVGNLLALTDARGHTTSFSYDHAGRVQSKTTALGTTETSTYDVDGNLTKFVDRRGQTSRFTYDVLNRLTMESYQDGTSVARSYDAGGRLVRVNDSVGGLFDFTYDLNGHLASSAGPFGVVHYARDAMQRVTSRTVVGQAPVEYTYDPAGNLLTAATQHAQVSLGYDERNAILNLNRSNGVTTAYAYDPVGRLRSLTHANAGGTVQAQQYTYDATGFRTAVTTGSPQALTSHSVSNQFDANNRLLQSGDTTFASDDNGNLTSATDPSGTTTYTWDARNRLQTIRAANGQQTALLYDFAGNLIGQHDSGPMLNRSRHFVFDDLGNLALIYESNGDQISILDGRTVDQHFAIVHVNGAVEYSLTDGNNSTVETVDEAGGKLEEFFYEPFGKTTANGSAFPFQYTGRVPITGSLYSYRSRYYDSALGRFTSEDPIGFLGLDVNLYRYVHNSPTNLIDPDGTNPLVIGAAVVIGYFTYQGIKTACQGGEDVQLITKLRDAKEKALLRGDAVRASYIDAQMKSIGISSSAQIIQGVNTIPVLPIGSAPPLPNKPTAGLTVISNAPGQ